MTCFLLDLLPDRLPLAKFFAFNLLCWGVVLGATAATHNFAELMVTYHSLRSPSHSLRAFSS
jgi:hypothetical protein